MAMTITETANGDLDGDAPAEDGGTEPVVPTHAQRTFQRQSIQTTLKN
jgi:hypothetical protein